MSEQLWNDESARSGVDEEEYVPMRVSVFTVAELFEEGGGPKRSGKLFVCNVKVDIAVWAMEA